MAVAEAVAAKVGKIGQVIGPVVDIEFEVGQLPSSYNAVRINGLAGGHDVDVIVEVEQHLGENRVRTVAMKPTDGLQRGMTATDLGGPISMPVGPGTLGRVMNVLGEPVDFPDRPVVLPFRLRDGVPAGPFETVIEKLLDVLPPTALVLAAQDLDLEAQPDDGVRNEISQAMDSAERLVANARQAEEDSTRARDELQQSTLDLEKAREGGADEAELKRLEAVVVAAEQETERQTRRAAKARAKANDAVSEAQSLLGDGRPVPETVRKRLLDLAPAETV
jgi:hypothetical protein